MWINLDLLFLFENFLKISRILKTPIILLYIKLLGLSIDLSTCVSAAKLKIPTGLYLNIIFANFLFAISHLIYL